MFNISHLLILFYHNVIHGYIVVYYNALSSSRAYTTPTILAAEDAAASLGNDNDSFSVVPCMDSVCSLPILNTQLFAVSKDCKIEVTT